MRTISEITNEAVVGTVIEWKNEESELPIKVTIASGLPKGDKLEYIVQKGTELGAVRVYPFYCSSFSCKMGQQKGK